MPVGTMTGKVLVSGSIYSRALYTASNHCCKGADPKPRSPFVLVLARVQHAIYYTDDM
jgi:hypothetical protein